MKYPQAVWLPLASVVWGCIAESSRVSTTDGGVTSIGNASGGAVSWGSGTSRDNTQSAGGASSSNGQEVTAAAGRGGARAQSSEVIPQVPACASGCNSATPSYPILYDNGAVGNVTMYETHASNGGACLYGNTAVEYYAAAHVNVAPGDGLGAWDGGRICGQCVEVTVQTTKGPQSRVVRIMDKCPDVHCGMDLGGKAPSELMLDGFGRYNGSWQFVSCAGHAEVFDGKTALFVKDGSNPYWAAVQVRNPNMAVVAMSWQKKNEPSLSGEFAFASPQVENYYLVPQEVLQADSDFEVTVHYRDASVQTITLSSAELAKAEASYALE